MHQVIDLTDRRNIYFVGDIHGDADALFFFLEQVGFNYRDAIVSVGDLVDRGDRNLDVINFFLHTDNAYAVRGNHEDMPIQGLLHGENTQLNSWLVNGGTWIVDYPQPMIENIFRKLEELPIALTVKFENTKIGVVHAECPIMDWDTFVNNLDYYPWRLNAIWGRERVRKGRAIQTRNINHVISGHTVHKHVVSLGNNHWIDTGSVFQSVKEEDLGLTFLCLDGDGFEQFKVNRDFYQNKQLVLTELERVEEVYL